MVFQMYMHLELENLTSGVTDSSNAYGLETSAGKSWSLVTAK